MQAHDAHTLKTPARTMNVVDIMAKIFAKTKRALNIQATAAALKKSPQKQLRSSQDYQLSAHSQFQSSIIIVYVSIRNVVTQAVQNHRRNRKI